MGLNRLFIDCPYGWPIKHSATRVNYERKVLMNKKMFVIALVLLVLFAVGVIYAQVCVIASVTVTGHGTNTATFTNNSTTDQYVRVEVRWDGGGTKFGINVPAGSRTGSGNNARFVPGTNFRTFPGIINYINECP